MLRLACLRRDVINPGNKFLFPSFVMDTSFSENQEYLSFIELM